MEELYFDQQDIDSNKGLGILISIFNILFFLPLVIEERKSSEWLKFRANQSLVLFIGGIACNVITVIPVIGTVVGLVGSLILGVLGIINLVYAVTGSAKKTPLIGEIVILK